MPEILTLEQVANYLQITPMTVYHLIGADEITAFKVGRHWRIDNKDLTAYIQQQKEKVKNGGHDA